LEGTASPLAGGLKTGEEHVNARSANLSDGGATGWVLVLTAVGSLMAALDTLVVSTALPTIRVHLRASVAQLEWTVNAYNLRVE
jgi:hypothetical protein